MSRARELIERMPESTPEKAGTLPGEGCLRRKRQASEGCDLDSPHSESDEDVTTFQGSPAPGQCSLHSKEDQTLLQPNPTIRALEAAEGCHHPPHNPTEGGAFAGSHLPPGTEYHPQGERGNHLKLTKC